MAAVSRSIISLFALALTLVSCSQQTDHLANPLPSQEQKQSQEDELKPDLEISAEEARELVHSTETGFLVHLVPSNPHGDILSQNFRTDNEMDTCADVGHLRMSQTSNELASGFFLLASTEDGPNRISDGVPVEYAQTPAGAALAAYNAASLSIDFTAHSKQAITKIFDFGEPYKPYVGILNDEGKTIAFFRPKAFKVTDCTDTSATVSLLFRMYKSEDYRSITLPVVYRDKTWVVKTSPEYLLSGDAVTPIPAAQVDWSQWTPWEILG